MIHATTIPTSSLTLDSWSPRNAPRVGGLATHRAASRSANVLYASINASHPAANPIVAIHDADEPTPNCLIEVVLRTTSYKPNGVSPARFDRFDACSGPRRYQGRWEGPISAPAETQRPEMGCLQSGSADTPPAAPTWSSKFAPLCARLIPPAPAAPAAATDCPGYRRLGSATVALQPLGLRYIEAETSIVLLEPNPTPNCAGEGTP
jgi:hypothetical protein